MLDNQIHAVYKAFHREIRWHDFSEVGLDEPYFDWYYAENRLYVIRNRLTEEYWFVEANNPAKAMEAYHDMCCEVMRVACDGED